MNFIEELIKNIFVLAIYRYLSFFLSFLSTIIVARIFAPEIFAEIAIIGTVTGFATLLVDPGVSYNIIRENHIKLQLVIINSTLIINSLFIYLFLSTIYPIIIYLFKLNIDFSLYLIALLIIPIYSLSILPMALANKFMEMKVLGRQRMIQIITTLVMIVLFSIYVKSIWTLLLSNILGTLASTAYMLYHFNYLGFCSIGNILHTYKKMIPIYKNYIGFRIIQYWELNCQIPMVAHFYNLHSVGIFYRAFSLVPLIIELVTGLFTVTLYPMWQKLIDQGATTRQLWDEYKKIMDLLAIIGFILVIIFSLFKRQIVQILWGDQWVEVVPILSILPILIMFTMVFSTIYTFVFALKTEKNNTSIALVQLFSIISSTLYGIDEGISGIILWNIISIMVIQIPFMSKYIFVRRVHISKKELFEQYYPIYTVGIGSIILEPTQNINSVTVICGLSLLMILILFKRNLVYFKNIYK